MDKVKEEALRLRVAGYSYNEIVQKTKISKSTLYSWLHDVVLPENAIARLKSRVAQGTLNGLIKRNKMQTVLAKERAEEIKREAKTKVKKVITSDLLLIGAVLYWAEGYKRLKVVRGREVTSHVVSLTNSDPEIVSAFILFLMQVLKIPSKRIFIAMRLFKHQKEEEAIRYWTKITRLPRAQFTKPTYPVSLSSRGKRPFNRLPYGTVQVIVSDTQIFYRIMGFIEGIKEQLRVKILPR